MSGCCCERGFTSVFAVAVAPHASLCFKLVSPSKLVVSTKQLAFEFELLRSTTSAGR